MTRFEYFHYLGFQITSLKKGSTIIPKTNVYTYSLFLDIVILNITQKNRNALIIWYNCSFMKEAKGQYRHILFLTI